MSNYKLYEYYRKKGETEEKKTFNPFETQEDAEALFDTKLSNALTATDEVFHFLMVINETGDVLEREFVGEGYMSPKLFSFKWEKGTEKLDTTSYDVASEVKADYYSKLGSAKRNDDIQAIGLRGVDAKGADIISTYWVRIPANTSEPTTESEE